MICVAESVVAGLVIADTGATMIAPSGAVGALPPDEEEEQRRPWWPWLLAGLFVVAAAIAGVIVWHQLSGDGPQVPVGLYSNCESAALAKSQITTSGFVVEPHHGPSTKCAKGDVYQQDPTDGTLPRGSTVKIWISTGKPQVTIPPLIGQSWTDASAALTGLGLKPVRHIVAGGKTKDIVTATAPAAGQKITVGDKVTVNVTAGPAISAVPNVANESVQQAQADLAAAGFNLVVGGYADSTLPQNYVVSQDPTAGSSLAQGSPVRVTLSNGPPMKTVPNVVQETSDRAMHDLQVAGFKVVKAYVIVNDPTQNGIVQSQNPGANSQATQGSTVTITIGQYSGPPSTTTTSGQR